MVLRILRFYRQTSEIIPFRGSISLDEIKNRTFLFFLCEMQSGILTINFENCTLFRAFARVARLGQWHFHAAVLFSVLAADFQRWFKFKTENQTSGETWASHGNRRTMAMWRKGSRYFAARHDEPPYSLAKDDP